MSTYLVTLATPRGEAQLEVPSLLGPDAAGRRAKWTGVSLGWGDVHEVTVTAVEQLEQVA